MTVTGKIDVLKVSKGHSKHRSGAGKHAHKCVKRLKTRSSRNRAAIND